MSSQEDTTHNDSDQNMKVDIMESEKSSLIQEKKDISSPRTASSDSSDAEKDLQPVDTASWDNPIEYMLTCLSYAIGLVG